MTKVKHKKLQKNVSVSPVAQVRLEDVFFYSNLHKNCDNLGFIIEKHQGDFMANIVGKMTQFSSPSVPSMYSFLDCQPEGLFHPISFVAFFMQSCN